MDFLSGTEGEAAVVGPAQGKEIGLEESNKSVDDCI